MLQIDEGKLCIEILKAGIVNGRQLKVALNHIALRVGKVYRNPIADAQLHALAQVARQHNGIAGGGIGKVR